MPEDIKIGPKRRTNGAPTEYQSGDQSNKLGKTFKVIIDRMEDDFYVGRTEFDSPEVDNEVLIDIDSCDLEIGKFYKAKIVQVDSFDLYAEMID